MQDDKEKKKVSSEKPKIEIKVKSDVAKKTNGALKSESQQVEKKENRDEFLVEFGPEVTSNTIQTKNINDELGELFGNFTMETSEKPQNSSQNQSVMSDILLLGNSNSSSSTNNKIDTSSILALYGSSNSQMSTSSINPSSSFQHINNPHVYQNQYQNIQTQNQFSNLFPNQTNHNGQNSNLFDFDLFEKTGNDSNVASKTVPADLWHM